MDIVLIGNPNSGKTTLYNNLTGAYEKTGNRSGVTVELKSSKYKKDKSIKIIDLPGLYQLNSTYEDEKIVKEYLLNNTPDVIINVLDGTRLEKSLNLTLSLIELNIPLVCAVNFKDELLKNGIEQDYYKLSKSLGVKVLGISALKKSNLDTLIKECKTANKPSFSFNELNTVKRFEFIHVTVNEITVNKELKGDKLTEKIDKIVTGKYTGILITVLSVIFLYFFSNKVGGIFSEYIKDYFSLLINNLDSFILKIGGGEIVSGFITCGIIKGIGEVLTFLPQILCLYIILTIMEESGFTSRMAFNLDRIFSIFNLSGKTVIPLILSCGCTVTGILSTRTIEKKQERETAISICPFMPCGAKIAVFSYFSYKLFNGSVLVSASLYFLGIIVSALFCKIKIKSKKEEGDIFILDMPTYRIPSFNGVVRVLLEKIKDYLVKAGTVILFVSVLIWLLSNFNFSGYVYGNKNNSFLFIFGNFIKYIFYPLGFCNAEASVSLLTGILAKESIIETLSLISKDVNSLFINKFSAYGYLAFILLMPPCIATISTMNKELKNKKSLIKIILTEFFTAYSVALIINFVGMIIEYSNGLIFFGIVAIIIINLLFLLFIKKRKRKEATKCPIIKPNTTL